MRKIKIPKIKLGRESVWHMTLLVFFVLFVVVFALNLYSLFEAKEELSMDVGEASFNPLILKKAELNEMIAKMEKRQSIFENIILSKPDIKDPYGEEIVEEEGQI